jgi:ABC-type sugar transport system ATPase subunit
MLNLGRARLTHPEARSLSAASARRVIPETRSLIRMSVNVSEPAGAETHVFGRLGEDEVIAVVRERLTCAEGAEIGVSIAPKHIHLFSPVSKARVNLV